MLNFRNTNCFFVLLSITLTILYILNIISILYIYTIILIYMVILAYGAISIQINFYFKSIHKLKNNKAVLLTFDDGPDPINTPKILDLLDKYNIKALFFMIGAKAEKYPHIVKEVSDRGHIIGNHSYTHHNLFDLKSSFKMTGELDKTSKILEQISGQSIELFRPPFGVTNPNVKKATKESKLHSIGWSFRSFDTTQKQVDVIVKQIEKKIKGGEILLFHDDRAKAVEVLELSLPYLSGFKQGEIANEYVN